MTKEELLSKLNSEMAGSGHSTIQQFSSIVARFYNASGGRFTRGEIVNYMKRLERQRYRPRTRAFQLRVLRRAFQIANKIDKTIEWPFGRRMPSEVRIEGGSWEDVKIAFSHDEIMALINGAPKLDGNSAALVALSTIYGLRRSEMTYLDSDALNLKAKRLRVYTKHGSRIREHIIPDVIIPYLEHYKPVASDFKLSQMFHEIEEAVGLPERYGTGWHSVRRGVVNALVGAGLDKILIYDFMRWKLSMQFGMLGEYFSEAPETVDQKIFYGVEKGQGHPFLRAWENEDKLTGQPVKEESGV